MERPEDIPESVWAIAVETGNAERSFLGVAIARAIMSAKTEGRKECAFEKWCDEVDRLARGIWPEQASYTADTGVDFWRAAFELGSAPEAAWNDEVLAAQDM